MGGPRHLDHGRPQGSRRLAFRLTGLSRHDDRHGAHHGRRFRRLPEMLMGGIGEFSIPGYADQELLLGLSRLDEPIINIRFTIADQDGVRAVRRA